MSQSEAGQMADPSQVPAQAPAQGRTYVLILLTLVYTSSYVDRQIMAILLPYIKVDMHLSDTALGFLSGTAFALFYATLGIPVAALADRKSRKTIITVALVIWSGMTALCGLAQNFWQLAAARIGVGVGEAGSSPPSHSMIADLYPAHERATAMAFYGLGINAGLLIGFLFGGWITEIYGWRAALLSVGLPGLALAALVWFTLREPPRGFADGLHGRARAPAAPIGQVFAHMWHTKALRHIIAGATLVSFNGYAGTIWIPAFLVRNHGFTAGVIGTNLALIIGVAGGLGTFLGGVLADRLSKRDLRWRMWVIAAAMVIAAPFGVATLFTESKLWVWLLFIPPAAVGALYVGPSFAMVQTLVDVKMRATASAILLFIVNLVGLGMGPQVVGILSDLLRPLAGEDSLRWAIMICGITALWGALHFVLAARTLEQDLAAAQKA